MTSLAKKNYLSELEELDWDFAGQNVPDGGLARSHWYPARFVPQVPGILIGFLSEPGDLVLDPFCGSGTTLVEALRLNRDSIGIDVNPVATMISRAKTLPIDEARFGAFLDQAVKQASDLALSYLSAQLLPEIPNRDENLKWYEFRTLCELSAIWNVLKELDPDFRVLGLTAFSAILRFACSQEKHWGWICDNVRPKTLAYRDTLTLFRQKLISFGNALSLLEADRTRLFPSSPRPSASVTTGPCATALASVPTGSCRLVVTSPPYYVVTDYIRSQRLSLLWLEQDLDAIKVQETGARFKRFRQHSLSEYLSDMEISFREIRRTMIADGKCCIVIGESPHREPYLDSLVERITKVGWELEHQLHRTISVRRTLTPQVSTEHVLILRAS